MLIKKADDPSEHLDVLEAQAKGDDTEAKRAQRELRIRKAGLRAERESAYLIDHDFGGSKNWAVIHDLRLEHEGRVAQIDHLLVNRWMQFYVLETKGFHDGLKINDEGEFLRWNNFSKRYEGMPSPLMQNDRHIAVLRDVLETIELPTRLGLRIPPEFMSLVLVSPNAKIHRPAKFDASRVIKADQLRSAIWRDIDGENPLVGLLKTATKIVASETVEHVARELAKRHSPLRRRLTSAPELTGGSAGVPSHMPSQPTTTQAPGIPRCKSCDSRQGEILYGKYGYYFKCAGCASNTAIRFACQPGHKPRLRKEREQFYRECADCGTSELFHTNSTTA